MRADRARLGILVAALFAVPPPALAQTTTTTEAAIAELRQPAPTRELAHHEDTKRTKKDP